MLFVGQVYAGDYTVSLTADQETALLYATELANVQRVAHKDAEGNPLPLLTTQEVLTTILAADLANVLRNLDSVIAPVQANLALLDANTLTKVLATVASQATKDRIQQRLAQ